MARGSGIRRGVAPQFVEVARKVPSLADAMREAKDGDTIIITPDNEVIGPAPSNVHYLDKFTAPAITLSGVSMADIDRLWDWVRSDPEGTQAFTGKTFENSRDLFAYIQQLAQKEREHKAAFYSIMDEVTLLGFIMLDPIIREPRQNPVGTTHVYLQPEARGRLREILPAMLAQADQVAPGMNLCVITSRGEWASTLEAVGFTTHIVLTRQSPVTDAAHG